MLKQNKISHKMFSSEMSVAGVWGVGYPFQQRNLRQLKIKTLVEQ